MATGPILVLNGGSSSLKYALFNADTLACERRGHFEAAEKGYEAALESALAQTEGVSAVGHRVVHGGKSYSAPTRIDRKTLEDLRALTRLAPLHQPYNLRAIDLLLERDPELPQYACFDTAFHRSQPLENQLYALPRSYADEGIVRYGFHGLSYEYVASELPHVSELADGRVIVMHLGSGASACAMKRRKSVAATMGFTALDGLMMNQRCGRIDPGVILYLMERGMSHDDIQDLLYRQSGLLGVSGSSSDLRDLLAGEGEAAALAVEMYCRYAARCAGELAAELQGLDALVFTAGIGENQPPIRERICAKLSWLGVEIDADANAAGAAAIGASSSRVECLVIPTDEELVVARHVAAFSRKG